uniref:SPRY domain-containing protein 3 n=1 Tax=Myxine glutinosa TaxID=7769 RepID=UPI00358E8637
MAERARANGSPIRIPKRILMTMRELWFPCLTERSRRILVDKNVLSYQGNSEEVGCYVAARPVNKENDYFEVSIVEGGERGEISVGLVPYNHHLDHQPGSLPGSVAFHSWDGQLSRGKDCKRHFGPRCQAGDRVGCGIKSEVFERAGQKLADVFFSRNDVELGSLSVPMPAEGLFPAVSMCSAGEVVQLELHAQWQGGAGVRDDVMMVDGPEDEWSRLHNVRLVGPLLEYAGHGGSILDVGLAQARLPLDTTNHYFEVQIMDPGERCYIAIGVARNDYPKHRHPGWNRGSIAYHADDGKIFHGSGVGDPFGPRCSKGDVMGCGIMFPRDYQLDSEGDSDETLDTGHCSLDTEFEIENDVNDDDYADDDDDDDDDERDLEDDQLEEIWKPRRRADALPCRSNMEKEDCIKEEMFPESQNNKVMVFFTRNGKLLGKREAVIPAGGFYPTVGMMSCFEMVRVELRPLSG